MIVTLTANPSLDRTIELDGALERGEVQRSVASREQPGGKGVNVSRALIASGLETIAVLPGEASDPMLVALQVEGTPMAALPIDGRVRSNVTITEPDGTTTKINEPGPTLSTSDDAALIELVIAHTSGAHWLVLAGSLPPGLTADFYARLVTAVRAAHGERAPLVAVDSSGEPMRALVDSGVGVDLVKPNGEELAELTGLSGNLEESPDVAVAAARTLLCRGARAVLATLGAKGAILVSTEGIWGATMPPVEARSTVGAGDAALSGYLYAHQRGENPRRRLAQAVAHGAAAASLPGSTMPSPDQTHPELARVRDLDASS